MARSTSRANRRRRWWLRAMAARWLWADSAVGRSECSHAATASGFSIELPTATPSDAQGHAAPDRQPVASPLRPTSSIDRIDWARAALIPPGVELLLRKRWSGMRLAIPLDQPFLLIGRDQACGLQLPGARVADRHAALVWVRGTLAQIDLTGRTPLVAPVQPRRRLRLADWTGDVAGLPTSENGQSTTEPAADPVRDAAGAVEVTLHWCPEARRRPTSLLMGLTLVGTHRDCGLSLDEPALATVQAALVLSEQRLWLIDFAGGQRVRVNGVSRQLTALDPGDRLEFGDLWAEVSVRWPADDRVTERAAIGHQPEPQAVDTSHHKKEEPAAPPFAPVSLSAPASAVPALEEDEQALLQRSVRFRQMQQRLDELLSRQFDTPVEQERAWQHFRELVAECDATAIRSNSNG